MESGVAQASAFLQSRVPLGTGVRLKSAFQSYVTGLRYFPHADKPKVNTVYICKRDLQNQKFPNAIKVYSSKSQVMGYVPRDLAETLVSQLDPFLDSRVLLCFCKSEPTQFSASCFYFIYETVESTNHEPFFI